MEEVAVPDETLDFFLGLATSASGTDDSVEAVVDVIDAITLAMVEAQEDGVSRTVGFQDDAGGMSYLSALKEIDARSAVSFEPLWLVTTTGHVVPLERNEARH